MTHYLQIDEVILLHDRQVKKFGGTLGIRDEKLLESAVFRCQASYGGSDLYETIFEKSAALFHGIIFNHAFIDGNKRTALMSAGVFLFHNGYLFDATDKELVTYPLFAEQTRPDISQIASWFKSHCKKKMK